MRLAKPPAPIRPSRGLPSVARFAAAGAASGAGVRGWLRHGSRGPGVAVGEEQGPLRGRPVSGQPSVGLGGALDRQHAVDQRSEVEAPGRHQGEGRLHVALLGPAHIADRVVEPALLVLTVVAPRPVGAGDAEAQLLLEERGPRELDRHFTDEDQRSSVPAEPGTELQGLALAGARGHQGGVDPGAAGQGADQLLRDADQRGAVGVGSLEPGQPALVDVEGEDLATGGAQKLACEPSDQAAADHRDPFADRHLAKPDSVQRDRRHGCECGVLERHAVGHLCAEVGGDGDHLGVVRVTAAAAGDPVARLQAPRPGADLEDGPGRAVADGSLFAELTTDRVDGAADPFLLGLLDHLADEVGPLARLADQGLLR